MAPRSTRNKIRWQAKLAIDHVEAAIKELASLEITADGKHPLIEKQMPNVIFTLQLAQEVVKKFRQEL